MTVQYIEYHELQNRGAVDPAESSEVDGVLLVGTQPSLTFEANYSQYGNDYIKIFPAFHNGERCWLQREEWSPAYGYSASGTQESLISFEEGVALFLERGVFEFVKPE